MATWQWTKPFRKAAVKQNAINAAKAGIDQTMAEAVQSAKSNHPGWQNRTGTAEGSIQMRPAEVSGNVVRGTWGSFDVKYFIHLEMIDSTLRRAADNAYPKLQQRIRENFG